MHFLQSYKIVYLFNTSREGTVVLYVDILYHCVEL